MEKLLLIGTALLSIAPYISAMNQNPENGIISHPASGISEITSHPNTAPSENILNSITRLSDKVEEALVNPNISPDTLKGQLEELLSMIKGKEIIINSFEDKIMESLYRIDEIIPIIKNNSLETLSEENRNKVFEYRKIILSIADKLPPLLSFYYEAFRNMPDIPQKKVTEQIKSLIKYAPLFEEFNDWCSKNLQCLDTPTVYRFFRHLDTPTVYRFFQQLSKSLSEANYWFINDQNSPSHHYIDFPWNDISNSSLYSEKQGFNPLAIAIIWPHLEYNFYKIIDKPIVSDLIKGIINYTMNILKDPKMFEAFIIPKIIKGLALESAKRKESLIESLICSLDGKESVITMIQREREASLKKKMNSL